MRAKYPWFMTAGGHFLILAGWLTDFNGAAYYIPLVFFTGGGPAGGR
jgi:hypothetical protein